GSWFNERHLAFYFHPRIAVRPHQFREFQSLLLVGITIDVDHTRSWLAVEPKSTQDVGGLEFGDCKQEPAIVDCVNPPTQTIFGRSCGDHGPGKQSRRKSVRERA